LILAFVVFNPGDLYYLGYKKIIIIIIIITGTGIYRSGKRGGMRKKGGGQKEGEKGSVS